MNSEYEIIKDKFNSILKIKMKSNTYIVLVKERIILKFQIN